MTSDMGIICMGEAPDGNLRHVFIAVRGQTPLLL